MIKKRKRESRNEPKEGGEEDRLVLLPLVNETEKVEECS
jgi:hypothetical protein